MTVDASIHLARMAELTGETDVELLPIDTMECVVCGRLGNVDSMLLANVRSEDIVCSESCAADYKQLASERIHGEP
jgi:hypothetical protein